MRDLQIPVPGGRINVWQRKGDPTVLMVHGITSTSRAWTKVIAHLPEHYGVVAMDVRGRGQSWEAPPPFDFATIAEDMARALDEIQVDRAVVAGWSMGAWVAAAFANRHPDRTKRVVLVDGGLSDQFDPTIDVEQLVADAIGPALARLELTFPTVSDYHDWWRRHPSFTGRWNPDLDEIITYDLRPTDDGYVARVNREAVMVAGAETAANEDVVTAWAHLKAPTTLVVVDHGMLDQPGGFIPLAEAKRAAAANPSIVVRLLEGLNHYTVVLGDGAASVAAIITGE